VTSPRSPRTLIIIPAFNEEAALPDVLHDLHQRLPDLDVVVVDDGSTDGTVAVARSVGVPVLELPFNLGIGGALRAGFTYAVRNGYERALQFDADGQHDSDAIEALLAALDRGADMAIGSRFADGPQTYDVGRVRAGAMGVLRFVIRQAFGGKFTDTSSGFRAFTRPVLEYFSSDYPIEYMESVEALALALSQGFVVEEVPVHMSQRTAGSPSNRGMRLPYHYVRLLLVVLSMVGRSPSAMREATPKSETEVIDATDSAG